MELQQAIIFLNHLQNIDDELFSLSYKDYRDMFNSFSVPIEIELRDRKGKLQIVRVKKENMIAAIIKEHNLLKKPQLLEELKLLKEEINADTSTRS